MGELLLKPHQTPLTLFPFQFLLARKVVSPTITKKQIEGQVESTQVVAAKNIYLVDAEGTLENAAKKVKQCAAGISPAAHC